MFVEVKRNRIPLKGAESGPKGSSASALLTSCTQRCKRGADSGAASFGLARASARCRNRVMSGGGRRILRRFGRRPAIVLQADDIGRPKPSVFAGPGLRHVFEAVFLWDDQIPKEGFVVSAHFSSSLLPTYYIENRKKREKIIRERTVCLPTS
jgi:hypothetical protein